VSVVVDLEALEAGRSGRSVDGEPVAGADLEALLCDSALHRLVLAGRSSILDYGTATRTVPANLWNALVIRDEHCRWPGCDRPSHWCDAHHVVAFVDGGPTSADNLVVLCRRHHRRLHHPGWHAKLLPDGTFEVTDPGGQFRSSRPPAATAAAGAAFW
jgi:5-methylcytosine-specific restriction protein A